MLKTAYIQKEIKMANVTLIFENHSVGFLGRYRFDLYRENVGRNSSKHEVRAHIDKYIWENVF